MSKTMTLPLLRSFYGRQNTTTSKLTSGTARHCMQQPSTSSGTAESNASNSISSLLWFDTTGLAAFMAGYKASRIGVTATSSNSSSENSSPRALWLYRTDLHYVAGNNGQNDANTSNWCSGMTYSNPYNDHMITHGSTELLPKGGTITDSTIMTGQDAQDMVDALLDGCAVGMWRVPSGSTYSHPATINRILSSVSLIIEAEIDRVEPYPPTETAINASAAPDGATIEMRFSGASQGSELYPITGYQAQYAECDEGGTVTGVWTDCAEIETGATSGTIELPVDGEIDTYLKYRIRAVASGNYSDWVENEQPIRICGAPDKPTVVLRTNHMFLEVDITVEPCPSATVQTAYIINGGSPSPVVTFPVTGGREVIRMKVGAGVTSGTLVVYVEDGYGGMSDTVTLNYTASHINVGDNWLMFNGIRSDDMGCIMTAYMPLTGAALRASYEKPIGLIGDVALTEGDEIDEAQDLRITLFAYDWTDMNAVRAWLHGEGELILGNDAKFVFDARIDKAQTFERFSNGDASQLINLTVHVQPYRRCRIENDFNLQDETVVYNSGDVRCYPYFIINGSGDVSLTIGDRKITIQGIEQTATVDCRTGTVFIDNVLSDSVSGDFPFMEVGRNTVYAEGSFTNIVMKRRQLFR